MVNLKFYSTLILVLTNMNKIKSGIIGKRERGERERGGERRRSGRRRSGRRSGGYQAIFVRE
jgi:hypothetical protein